MLGGNSFYRLLLYLFYNIVSNFPTKNIQFIKNFIERETKRVYRGRIKGIKIFFRFEDIGTLRDIFIDKIYMVHGIKKFNSVVDIGAHIGSFSIFILLNNNLIKKIICIEPERDNFRILSWNLKNLSYLSKIDCLNIALSNKNTTTKLYLSSYSAAHGLKGKKGAKFQIVKTRKLDDVIHEKVDLIKVDVEGSEVEVLRGMVNVLRRYKPALIIETGHYKNETKIICRLLKKLKYKTFVLKRKEPIVHAFYAK
jgi:FkbM family methyltransferase